jgi:hypothetical protein
VLRDPLYREILNGLDRELDPRVFERAVAALIRKDYPGVVAVIGGDDAGMDAALPDWQGSPLPVVVTTSSKGTDNLKRNLGQYAAFGESQRRAVFATSHLLTGRQRRNLESAANNLGFVLVQVYDREAIAERLYYSPEWRQELLGIGGKPPALSPIPMSRRPPPGNVLVGRESDLSWLSSRDTDSVVVGQPGSGKTSTAAVLANDGTALFVVSEDPESLADAIRSLRPACLIVDDAHARTDLLRMLRQLRADTGLVFRIVATTWPGDLAVQSVLAVTDANVRELAPLTLDELVKVVQSAGLVGPNRLIAEVVRQAEGRPGLAVTLVHLVLYGGLEGVALGQALTRDVRRWLEELVAPEAVHLLAVMALAGGEGMSMDEAAKRLGLSLSTTASMVDGLARIGVISIRRNDTWEVRPSRLRQALVREVFFGERPTLPFRLFSGVGNRESRMEVLIGARALGGAVPDSVARPVDGDSKQVWRLYASLGRQEAIWALEQTARADLVGEVGLVHAADVHIPALLDAAVGDERELHSHPDHPLRILEDWVEGTGTLSEAMERRRQMWESARTWLGRGRDPHTGTVALAISLSPAVKLHETDPGFGHTITLRFGLLPLVALIELAEWWAEFISSEPDLPATAWGRLTLLAEDWVYPSRHLAGKSPGEDAEAHMVESGKRMLLDIADSGRKHPGVLIAARNALANLGTEVPLPLPPELETLFPLDPLRRIGANGYDDALKKLALPVLELAARWADSQPEEMCRSVWSYRRSVLEASPRTYPDFCPLLFQQLADAVRAPSQWAASLIDIGADADLIAPFLTKALDREPREAWMDLARTALQEPKLRGSVIAAFLREGPFPEELVEETVLALNGLEIWVDTAALRGDITRDRLHSILTLGSPTIAAAAAVGDWQHDPAVAVKPCPLWRRAILNAPFGHRWLYEYWLGELLKSNSTLAHDWLRRHLNDREVLSGFHSRESVPDAALRGLNAAGRACIAENLPDRPGLGDVAKELVGNDEDAFRRLLRTFRTDEIRTAPLRREPDERWARLALVALDEGYSEDRVIWAIDGGMTMWSGNESDKWTARMESFALLSQHADERVRRLASRGKELAEAERDRCLKEEREEQVRGW